MAPGYQEMWTGLLLKGGRCLGITRKLFTENMEFFSSQPALELTEIRYAVELGREAFKREVILVADRIDGNVNVEMRGWGGLLQKLIVHQPERQRMFWREDSKEPILSEVRAQRMWIKTDSGRTELSAVCLTCGCGCVCTLPGLRI